MSPIGRVFIVLNLLLAGAFVGFAGTYLQKQSNFKNLYEAEQKSRAADNQAKDSEIARLESERNQFEIQKTQLETNFGNEKNRSAKLADELKALQNQYASMEGDMKALRSIAEAHKSQSEAAFAQAKEAFDKAVADQKTRDDAVRAKDTAETENRDLKTQIASLKETIDTRDATIAGLEKERSELNLLVSVAKTNGFLPGMAAPTLSGTVAHVANNRLCTIRITDNPGNVDIADQLAKRSFSFAIYDASGYKGEAVATSYYPEDNAITCNLMLVKGEVKEGDKASTKTP